MTDDTLKRIVRNGGCRLCLAPDSECVPIFATAAADKEPLSNKIFSCVNIKILQADRMSSRICHACISFLNSWQSFKNRCHNAQKKQQQFLDVMTAKERAKQKTDLANQHHTVDRQQQHRNQENSNDFRQKILKSALLNSTPNSNGNNLSAIDCSFIKEEPEEYGSDLDDMDNVDPTQFLAQDNDEDPNAEHEHSQILASLGLTHISQQHNENSTNEGQNDSYTAQQLQYRSQASCTICNMQFSNRANARRHERNIHNVRISVQGGSTIIQHKDRPEIAIATPLRLKRSLDVPTVYDYTNPELYRSQLTDPRLNFIRRHMEFLEQYQTMTCKCCNKQFPTYKFFMAHMRKKYDTLSRNLCFKCLKQFQTKPQFIAHLKKRNCLNLYRVFMADDTISKEPLPSAPLRHGSKEILANKTYGCRLCSETFRLKNDFRTHVVEAHSDAQKREIPGATSCGYCSLEFEDSSERRRHFNNVECMVFIICGTCDEHFDTHAAYVEHVYAIHISANNVAKSEYLLDDNNGLMEEAIPPAQSKARSPQNCTVCGKQYNNYYNVLRHMESKHPDQVPTTYRCDRCEIGYPRQVELRDHMFRVHNERIKFDAIKVKREQYSCRECNGTFDDKDGWINHQAEEHSKFGCNQCEDEFEDKEKFITHLASHSDSKSYKCPVCQHSFSSERGFETHLSVVHNMTKDEVQDQSNEFGDEMPVECAVEINGDDDGASDSEDGMMMIDDGNDGDNDETLEHPLVKRLKIDESLQNSSTTSNASPENVSLNTTCRICKESFASRPLLITHMRTAHSSINRPMPSLNVAAGNMVPSQTHNVNNRLRCRICQKRIHTKNGYKRHMLQVHDVKDCVFIKCTLCPSEFSNDKGLKVHMYRTHNITVQQMQADESLVPIPKQESTSPTPSPVVPRTGTSQMFECNICHTVYRNRDQLKSHKTIVHGINEVDLEDTDMVDSMTADNSTFVGETWWQCRFCNESFNASKKLTIHMNSHAEYDNKETKCKDCGNVYGTRKSLWVHRQKKHPRLPNPSPCELCDKTFFDKTELFHHLSTHSNDAVFSHLQAMQEQLEQEQEQENRIKLEQGIEVQENLSCHVCNQKFHDKRVLSKHLRVHEQQKQTENSFSNSALAAMLADTDITTDENTGDYSYPTYKGQKVENGEFACDMCPKRFPHVNALKVHRGWHFRSPDGRQITDSNSIWRPDVGNHSRNKRSRAANPPVCPYCKSTFASGNNLRRHIVEVHKRNEAKMARENGGGDETFIEKELECMACDLTFSSRPEWIDHKINHARTMKPSTTYEWGCEICGKVFTRKERLLVHMTSHMSGKEEDINQKRGEMGFESNSQSSMSSHSHSQQMRSQHSLDSATLRNAFQMNNTSDSKVASVSLLKHQQSLLKSAVQSSNSNKIVQIKTNDSNESIEDDMDDDNSNEPTGEQAHPCDLCQAIFTTNKELRQHIKSHFEGEGLGQNAAETESNADDSQYEEEEDYENENEDMNENIIEEDYDEELGEEEDDYNDEEMIEQNSNVVHRTQVTGYNCRICGSSSQSHIDMLSCMENHQKPTQIECEECSFYFVNLKQLEKHESLCHPKEEYDDSD